MKSNDPVRQREFAVEVVEQLRAAGFLAYWAGGCVRDQLLGRTPKDYDVATNARPTEIRELFGKRRTLAIGAAFGVITVLGRKPAGQIEVATFRQDRSYSDGRHPDGVVFSTPHEDAQRRDFTINGIFFDPHLQQVHDFVGGQHDLELRLVRAIGEPRERFQEDKLRLLRAVRFATTFDFALEPATREAVIEMASQVDVVSVERIAAELRGILAQPLRRRGVELLAELGLLSAVLPELAAASASNHAAWQLALATLGALAEPSFALSLAALLLDLVSRAAAEGALRRLKLPNADIKRVLWLLTHAEAAVQAESTAWPQLQRLLVSEGSPELVDLAEARAKAAGFEPSGARRCRERLALPPEELNPPPLLTGDELVAGGIRPGRGFQKYLEAVRDAQLDKQISTQAEALAMVKQMRHG